MPVEEEKHLRTILTKEMKELKVGGINSPNNNNEVGVITV